MKIREVFEKGVWESFWERVPSSFAQSFAWGELHQRLGYPVFRLFFEKEGRRVGACQLIYQKTKRGRFWIAPHGPGVLEKKDRKEVLSALLSFVKEHSLKGDVLRVQPFWEREKENSFSSLGFRRASFYLTAQDTWEIDLSSSLEEIMASFRKTTRYLVRKSLQDPEIKIEITQEIEKVEDFYKLLRETSKRHHFTIPSLRFLKEEFSAFLPEALLFLGYKGGHLFSGAFVLFWQKTAFYHHGASLPSKSPVSYRIQWEVIKRAKEKGCRVYNMWGVAPKLLEDKNHPWWGLTLFKTGFGGQKRELEGAWDYPLSFRYWGVSLFEVWRKRKRGLHF